LLAAPVSLEQTTSAVAEGIEDRVTLTSVAARRLHEMAGQAIRLAALELICSAQAIDLRGRRGELGRGTAATYTAVRRHVPFVGAGQAPAASLDPLAGWLEEFTQSR
jgi:histidine ammonia-lyase